MTDYTLHCGDCVDYMATMADNSVDLIATDPPYHRVKMTEAWDRQHKTAADFLSWLDTVLAQFERILKPNGSLYLFASPKMAARVEVLTAGRFNVLNRITWRKTDGTYNEGGSWNRADKDTLRRWFEQKEEIIFAEHHGADGYAKGEAGYGAKCDELRGFVFEPLRAYLAGERDRAGLTTRQVAEEFQRRTGSRTVTGMARHWLERVQWTLPTAENYQWLRETFSRLNHGGEYLRREYEDLRREYEDLRREYEDLRREYEDLRRPFNVTADVPYTDVWTFPTVQAYPGKHPAEKPQALLSHIIEASSKPGAVILDAFAGSGATGIAAQSAGREFVGIEKDGHWADYARARIAKAAEQARQLTLGIE